MMNKFSRKFTMELLKMAGSVTLIILWSVELTHILS